MSKFYPLIWKSVSVLVAREDREAAYEHSRQTLRAMQENAAFSPEEISAQSRDLDEAIARAEREMEKNVRRQQAASLSSAIHVKLSLPTADAEPQDAPESVAEGAAEDTAPAAPPTDIKPPGPTVQSGDSKILRASKRIAAALAVLLVPLALWAYLHNAPTRPAAETKAEDITASLGPGESALLYRGPSKFTGWVSWRSEPGTSSDRKGAGFYVDSTFEAADAFPEGIRLALLVIGNASSKANPAPQIAELRFTSKSGQPLDVTATPGILIRKAGSEAGQPLLGLTAKSNLPGLFILGTSPASSDVETNLALLRDGTWLDVPFVANDGSPAMISIEVGRGRSMIRSAVDSWTEANASDRR